MTQQRSACSVLIEQKLKATGKTARKPQIFAAMPAILSAVLLFSLTLIPTTPAAAETVTMTLHTANPGPERAKKRVKQYLPAEISRDDVVDPAGMEVRFDEANSALYVFHEPELDPGQEKTYKVVLNDVWTISPEDVAFLKTQIESRLQFLQKTEDYQIGKNFADSLLVQLSKIQESQANASGLGASERIEAHRLNISELNRIRSQVTVMADFLKEARWFANAQDNAGTLKFVINAKNPLDKEQKHVEVKRYLPRGVQPDHIVEAEGFQAQYDPARSLYYVTRFVDLGPKQEFKATVVIKNVWKIPDTKIDLLVEKGEALRARLKNSQYDETGEKIIAELRALGVAIKELQAKSDAPLDMIANFSLNLTRFNAMEDAVDRLRELVEEIEHNVPQVVPYQVKYTTPDISTTWKIIYGVMGLLTLLGVLFFLLWWMQSKSKMGQKLQTYDKAA